MFLKQVIAVGSDHAGFNMKNALLQWMSKNLNANRYEIIDFGCSSLDSVDYPLYADAVCKAIQNGEANWGILICGTGVGMCMAANKHTGIRAVVGSDIGLVKLSREHNNANVLCLGARIGASPFQIDCMIELFLATLFAGNKRHQRRITLMDELCATVVQQADDAQINVIDDKLDLLVTRGQGDVAWTSNNPFGRVSPPGTRD